MSAPFPYAPRERVAANLRRELGKANNDHAARANCEAAYARLRAAAVNAICDLPSFDIS